MMEETSRTRRSCSSLLHTSVYFSSSSVAAEASDLTS